MTSESLYLCEPGKLSTPLCNFFSPVEMVHTHLENRAEKHDCVLSAHKQGPQQNGGVGG